MLLAKKSGAIRWLFLLFLLLAAGSACGWQQEPPAGTALPTDAARTLTGTARAQPAPRIGTPPPATATATTATGPSPPPAATPSATPQPTRTPPSQPTAAPTLTATSIFPPAPLLLSGRYNLAGWSPGGAYLGMWEPGGGARNRLVLANLQGERCAYPYPGPRLQPHQFRHAWLPGDVLVVIGADGSYTTGSSCQNGFVDNTGTLPIQVDEVVAAAGTQPTLAVRDGNRLWLLHYTAGGFALQEAAAVDVGPGDAFAFNPDGSLLAVTHAAGGTTLIASPTGASRQTIPWQSGSGGEMAAPPLWLDSGELLIPVTSDQGPLLWQNGEVIAVMPALFGRPARFAIAAGVTTGDSAFAILINSGEDNLLYHSATGTVEQLPPGQFRLEPAGRWLFRYVDTDDSTQLLRRPLRPGGGDFVYLAEDWPRIFWQVSPGGAQTAVLLGESVIRVDAAGEKETFSLPGVYGAVVAVWSPDGKTLAVQGRLADESGWAIFLLPGSS